MVWVISFILFCSCTSSPCSAEQWFDRAHCGSDAMFLTLLMADWWCSGLPKLQTRSGLNWFAYFHIVAGHRYHRHVVGGKNRRCNSSGWWCPWSNISKVTSLLDCSLKVKFFTNVSQSVPISRSEPGPMGQAKEWKWKSVPTVVDPLSLLGFWPILNTVHQRAVADNLIKSQTLRSKDKSSSLMLSTAEPFLNETGGETNKKWSWISFRPVWGGWWD